MEKDPWDRRRHDEPPGLDEIFSSFMKGGDGKNAGMLLPFIIAAVLLFIASGFFIVGPAEKAVITRFGKVQRVVGPGPNWVIPGVDNRFVLDVFKIKSYNYSAEMLTSDESYANVDVTIFYRIKTPQDYLFNTVDPEDSLAQATASALRQVVGNTRLQDVLTDGREEVREQIHQQLVRITELYQIGLEITDTKLQDAQPPAAVKAAFDDIIQAREDYQRFVMDAEGYRNNVLPKAQGQRMRIENQANADYERIILEAKASVAGFVAIVPDFKKAPDIITNKIFISTMEDIYTRVQKVFVENDSSVNILPLGDAITAKEKRNEQ